MSEKIDINFRKRLVKIRGNETRKEFAEKLKMPASTLRGYEVGETVPHLAFWIKLHTVTKLPLDYLILGKTDFLSEDELLVIKQYRLVDDDVKNQILLLLLKNQTKDKSFSEQEKQEMFQMLFGETNLSDI